MTPATSASDRYAEARALLQHFDGLPDDIYREDYNPHTLADALRALITPPASIEPIHNIVHRIDASHIRPPVTRDETGLDVRITWDGLSEALTAAVHAGIQAAWESWESDDYAPTLCEKCGADA